MTSYLKVGVLHPLGHPKTCTFFDLACTFITGKGEPLTIFATMAKHEGRVQLKQSDIRLALNIGKMPQGGFLCSTIEEMQHVIKNPCSNVQGEKPWGVEFPGHKKVKTVRQRHLTMVRENQTDGGLPCRSGTAQNPQICWRC